MSFNPIFPKYIEFATESFCKPSGSINPLAQSILYNDMEWQYRFFSTQPALNIQVGYLASAGNFLGGGADYKWQQTSSNPDRIKWCATIGPFPVPLDKDAKPMPLLTSIVPALGTQYGVSLTGTFYVSYRPYDMPLNGRGIRAYGYVNQISNQNALDTGYYIGNTTWKTLTTSNSPFGSSSSIMEVSLGDSKLPVQAPVFFGPGYTKELTEWNHSPDINGQCLVYMDIWFRAQSSNLTNYVYWAGIKGAFVMPVVPLARGQDI